MSVCRTVRPFLGETAYFPRLRSKLLAMTQILARIRYNDAKLENDLGEQAPFMNVLQAKADGELDDGTAARAGSGQGAEGERSAVVSPRQDAWFGISDATGRSPKARLPAWFSTGRSSRC